MELLRRLAITALIVSLALILMFLSLPKAHAQCNWENWNCTPTPPPTPTGTITPTATPILTPVVFQPPQYDVPTSIPPLSFPTAPSALEFTPIPAPSPISIEITPIPTPDFATNTITISNIIDLATVNSTIDLSYTTPLTLDLSSGLGATGTAALSGSGVISGAVGDVSGWIGNDLVSYTNYLTGQVATLQGTATITVIVAPSWYAPALPRPMADVGWTFEQLTDPTGDTPDFTLTSWSSFFGYISSLPFQFIKTLWQIVAYLGPFGLFLGWLLIMFAIVLGVHFQVFIIKFLITIIRLVVRMVEILGGWIPTGG